MTTIPVDRAQLEQWLQAFKKIHGDKRSHWDVDEEISAIEKSLEPIAMEVMKTDEADFWRWWKPYQLKDCWRLEFVARDAWMAAKINTDADIAYLITKVKEAIHYPSCWDTAAYPTLQSALHELTAWFKVSGCESCKTEQQEQDSMKFLANGARFKLTFDAKGRVSSLWHNMKELDGRWVALVAAEDDCHLNLTTPPTQCNCSQRQCNVKPLTDEQRIKIVKDNTVQGYHGDYFDAWGIIDDVEAAYGITSKE